MQRYWLKHMYEAYWEQCLLDETQYVSFTVFKALWLEYQQYIIQKVLYDGLTFVFPYQLGELYIEKYKLKTKVKHVDFYMTKQLGKTVYHTNEHSDGYKYAVRWSKYIFANVKNIEKYRFKFVRFNQRLLAKLIKSGGYDYIELDK